MNFLLPAVFATMTSAFVLFLVYSYLYFKEKSEHLKLLTFAWLFYFLRFPFEIYYINNPASNISLVIFQLLTYLNSVFILLGFYKWFGKTTPLFLKFISYIGIIWLVLGFFIEIPFQLFVGVPFYIGAILFIWTALHIKKNLKFAHLGYMITLWTLFIWGVHKMNYPFTIQIADFAPWRYIISSLLAQFSSIGIVLLHLGSTRQELFEREERFRRLVEDSPDAIALIQYNQIVYANPSFLKLFAIINPNSIINSSILNFISESSLNDFNSFINQISISNYRNENIELIMTFNGLRITCELSAISFVYNNQASIQVNIRDINQRKLIEKTLTDREEILKNIYSITANKKGYDLFESLGSFLVDNLKITTFVAVEFQNSGFNVLSIKPNYLNKSYFPDSDLNAFKELITQTRQVLFLNVISNNIFTNLIKEESKINEIASVILLDYDTNPNGFILLFFNSSYVNKSNIEYALKILAGRAGSEIERHNYEAEIAETALKYKHLFDISHQGLCIIDKTGKISLYNNSFARLIEISENSIEKLNLVDFVDDESKHRITNSLENPQSNGYLEDNEIRFITRNNNSVHAAFEFIQLEGNQIDNEFLIGFTDITERINYENELKKAKDKAEESDKLKSAFLANMSHEIRTPMNGIIGFSQMLDNPDISSVERQEYIGIIHSCGNQLMSLINDIVDISKIEAGQMTVNNKQFDLHSLLNDLNKLFIQNCKIKNVDLRLAQRNIESKLIIEGDEQKIRQILINLLSNAIKFTEKGYIEFGYSITSQRKPQLLFYVKDTGIGIAPQFHDLIFDRFRQAGNDSKKTQSGTGLGLAISKAFINLMGGKIWVESIEFFGTTFYFTIDYKPIIKTIKEATVSSTEKGIKYHGKSILIAEDNEINFTLVAKFLKNTGIQLIRARNGKEAVDIIKENQKVDLILMDVRMPLIDGYEATKMIHEIDKSIPIVAQTAYALSGDREKAMEAGCLDYLEKPIIGPKLFSLIDKHLLK